MVEQNEMQVQSKFQSAAEGTRNLTAGLFITLDGVVQAPNEWQFDVFDADMMDIMTRYLEGEDAILLGRVTYQEWAGYWPTSNDEPYASHINNTPKYVASNTLDRVDWKNSTLVRGGDLEAVIRQLKHQPGKNIGVAGSPTLVYWLFQHDLLDELTLMFHPVVAGRGKRLFPNQGELKRLQLVNTQVTGSGVIVATYHPRKV